ADERRRSRPQVSRPRRSRAGCFACDTASRAMCAARHGARSARAARGHARRQLVMTLLVAGLALFLGIHLLPVVPPLRDALQGRLGANGYRGAFTIASLAGVVLIVVGYRAAGRGEQLFAPMPAAVAIAPYAVTLSFVLFAAANMRTHIRKALRHPMLLGVLIWAAVHLCANGDTRGTVLFGAFLVWALVDL